MLLRQVAAYLEIDTALISKMERGERRLTREQVIRLASFYDVNQRELLPLWVCDRVLETVDNDEYALQGLKKAVNTLEY